MPLHEGGNSTPLSIMSKSSFPKTLLIGTLVLSIAGASAWYFMGKKANQAPEMMTVQVGKGDVTQVVTASGELQPITTIDVSSQVSGLIKEVLVDYNSVVKKGDVMARLDPATYDQRLKQADADLASTTANTRLVRLNTARTRELFAKGLATEADRDQADALLAQAEAQLLTRQASVEDARVNLSRCTIYAPIDGIVMQRATEPGKTVAASLNAPTLFIIAEELGQMEIVAAVAEADVGGIANGQAVTFRVDAYPSREFHGKVTQIRNYPVTSSNVVTYETIIEVDNSDLKLKPGMTATVSIITAQRKNTLRVSNAALRARVPESAITKPAGTAVASTPEKTKESKEVSPEERRRLMQEIFQEVGYSRENGRPTAEQSARIQELAKAKGIEWDPNRSGRRGDRKGSSEQENNAANTTRTLYRLLPSDTKDPKIEAVSVKMGISDGMNTEIIEGVNEGDTLVTTLLLPSNAADAAATPSNPFAPSPGRRR